MIEAGRRAERRVIKNIRGRENEWKEVGSFVCFAPGPVEIHKFYQETAGNRGHIRDFPYRIRKNLQHIRFSIV